MIPCPPTNPRISWLLTYKSYHWVCDWHSGARLGLLPVCSGHLDAAQRLLLRLALSLRCQVGERMIIMDEDPEQHQSQDNLRFPSCFYSSRRNVASPFADRALSVPPSTYTSGWDGWCDLTSPCYHAPPKSATTTFSAFFIMLWRQCQKKQDIFVGGVRAN